MGFGCFPLERGWGHIETNKPIAAPKLTADQLAEIVLDVREDEGFLTVRPPDGLLELAAEEPA